jgi:osmotically-inducible protein OsmY
MIGRFNRCAAVVVASSALILLAEGCNRTQQPVVTQEAVKLNILEKSDLDVTSQVKSALLRDADLKSFDITVVTTKGDVLLKGQVDKQSHIDSALVIVRGIKGVHSIHDELIIKK